MVPFMLKWSDDQIRLRRTSICMTLSHTLGCRLLWSCMLTVLKLVTASSWEEFAQGSMKREVKECNVTVRRNKCQCSFFVLLQNCVNILSEHILCTMTARVPSFHKCKKKYVVVIIITYHKLSVVCFAGESSLILLSLQVSLST